MRSIRIKVGVSNSMVSPLLDPDLHSNSPLSYLPFCSSLKQRYPIQSAMLTSTVFPTEFIALMSTTIQPKDYEEETRAAFAVFDKDGSGTISASELKAVMKSLGENLSDAEIDEMIREADKDQNGTIDCKFSVLCPRVLSLSWWRWQLQKIENCEVNGMNRVLTCESQMRSLLSC